jgi:hypothetical protein
MRSEQDKDNCGSLSLEYDSLAGGPIFRPTFDQDRDCQDLTDFIIDDVPSLDAFEEIGVDYPVNDLVSRTHFDDALPNVDLDMSVQTETELETNFPFVSPNSYISGLQSTADVSYLRSESLLCESPGCMSTRLFAR